MKIIYNDGHVAECPEAEELEVLRHSAAHIMAQAVKRLYPDAHFAYGPATEKGFHYDIDLGDVRLTDEDLPGIEAEMQKIVKENLKACSLQAVVRQEDALSALRREEKFDLIFVDPPYDAGLYGPVLETIKSVDKLTDGGIIICEARSTEPLPDLAAPYGKRKEYRYGKVKIAVYTKESASR